MKSAFFHQNHIYPFSIGRGIRQSFFQNTMKRKDRDGRKTGTSRRELDTMGKEAATKYCETIFLLVFKRHWPQTSNLQKANVEERNVLLRLLFS